MAGAGDAEAAAAAEASVVIGEVLDTLDGLVRLDRRSPTLDGAVPVRVARGCVPLLEGNAYGLQLTLTRPLTARRRLGRWSGSWDGGDEPERLHRGAVPRLGHEGVLPAEGAWVRALRGPLVRAIKGGLRLVTGLLVSPAASVWLRLTSAANRRNTLFDVVEQVVPDGAWVPLVVDLRFRPSAPAVVRLQGEIACLGALRPGVRVTTGPIGEAPALARAHASFYDRAYFEDKRHDVTGKYRRMIATEAQDASETAACRVAVVGASRHAVVPFTRFTTNDGPMPRPAPGRPPLDTIVFRNEIGFRAVYDGQNVTLDYDRAALAVRSRRVEDALVPLLSGEALAHPGARLYLTKYFTPHVPGEPHFFVKPWALTETPPGWSCLVDGIHGDGYDVWRGVVSTDSFHATPAVFRLHGDGAPIRVAEDAALIRVIPVPRALLPHEYRLRALA